MDALNITPKRKAVLQRIHDEPDELNWCDFKGPESAAITLLVRHRLIEWGESGARYVLTDKGRQALHEAS